MPDSERHVRAKLVVVDGEEGARQFDLQLPAIIGRSRSTDVTLGHPLISRHHCEVFESQGLLMLRDLGSRNGTFVGEARLSDEPIALVPGQRFTIGPLTLEASYQARVQEPPEAPWQPGGRTLDAPLAEEPRDEEPHEVDAPSSARPRGENSRADEEHP